MADMTDDEIRDRVSVILGSLHSGGGRLARLLDCSVGRILRRDIRKAGTFSIPVRPAHLDHIRDWLVAADLADAFWLSRTDAEGRPLKLMKLGSIEACNAEADKAMRLEAARVLPMDFGPDDESFEWDAGDGFAFVRLLSEKALDLESSRMGHCIGNGAYDGRLGRSDHAFLSLRGPNGAPHATLELAEGERGWTVRQAQGRENGQVVAAYRRRILAFLADYGIPGTRGLAAGFWTGPHGTRPARDACSLPSGSFVEGSLDFDGDGPVVLADGLRIEGDLRVVGPGLASLPRGLKVGGELRLEGCANLRSIPDDVEVAGPFVVRDCGVSEIRVPAGATGVDVRGDVSEVPRLALVAIPSLRAVDIAVSYSEEVRVGSGATAGDMNFFACTKVSFGSRIRIDGKLAVHGPSRLDLPGDMLVAGCLHARVVEGDVVVPEGWSSSSIDVERAGRVVLPDGLSVSGDLVLRSTTIDGLPERLRVGGDLEVTEVTGVTSLPDGLSVGGSIRIVRTALSRFAQGMKVSGDLLLVGTALESIPSDVVVGGDLVADVSLGALPKKARVAGRIMRAARPVEGPAKTTFRRAALGFVGDPGGVVLGDAHDVRILGIHRDEFPVHRPRTAAARPPKGFFGRSIVEVFRGIRFRGDEGNTGRHHGAVVDASGTIHACGRIPEGVVIEGDLDFVGTGTGPCLPKGTFVTGTMRLIGVRADELPDGLRIGGDLVVDAADRVGPTDLVLDGRVRVDGNLVLKTTRLVDSRPGCGIDVGGSAKLVSCRTSDNTIGSRVTAAETKPRVLASISSGGVLDVSRSPDIVVGPDVSAGGGVRTRMPLPKRALFAAGKAVGRVLVRGLENLDSAWEKRSERRASRKTKEFVPLREAVARRRRSG